MSLSIEGFLASPQQRRLWTLRNAGGGDYVAEAVVEIAGAVDPARLEAALRSVAARYEIFSTVFASLPGMSFPVQVLDGGRLPTLEIAAPDATVESELRRLAREVRDVTRGPLLRASLAGAGEGRSSLAVVLPALCADGPTLTALLGRTFEAYDGREGEGEEPLQYADLSSWQNDLLESGEAAEERRLLHEPELWTRREAALPFPRTAGSAAFSPIALPFRPSPGLGAAVAALAGREGVEPGAVLLAAWLALLSRLSGERDLVVGATFDGRRLEELRDAVGPLAKSLPLRAVLEPDEPWLRSLRRVAEGLRFLGPWQEHFSVEQLASGAGDAAAAPYFPVGFACEGPLPDFAAGGLRARVERCRAFIDRFDLALVCRGGESGIAGEILFDEGTLDRDFVLPLPGRLAALLEAACRRPETRLAELPVLGGEERRLWLVERNDTRRASTLGATLPSLVEARVALHPDRVAVSDGSIELTYGELDRRANGLATHLRHLGVGPETLVAVCLDRSPDLVATLLGVLKAGGAYVPLDPAYPAERLSLLLESSGARLLVTTSGLAGQLPWRGPTLRLDREAAALAAGSCERPEGGPDPASLAYVIYTSGSTGRPKGVMISHGAICNRLLWMQEELPLGAGDRVLQKTPVSFDASVWELFCPLLAGARLELARPGGHQDAAYMVRTVAEREVTVLQLVPSALRMVLEVPELERCTSLARLFCGGEALAAELRDRFFARLPAGLVNLYGPTEVSIDATFHVCRRGASGDEGPIVPLGRPLANTRLYLLDPSLLPVVPGARGELYVGGAGLARGYLGRPDLTAERFLPDPWSGEPGARLYRTGDLARFRPDGAVEFLGRADQQVKIRGFRIEPGEVEAALTALPEVRAAVVAPREVAPGDVRLLAWIVPAQPGTGDAPGLRERLRGTLPEHLVPSDFVFLAELPLLPNGKLDRASLPLPGTGPREEAAGPVRELRTPVEDLLSGLWSEVLGRDAGLHDNVFDLGAHSLLVTQVVSRLREVFRVDLPMRTLFDEPTVAGLARHVQEAMRSGGRALPPIERVARGGPLPVSSAQQRLWFLDQLDPGSPAYSTPLVFRLSGALRVPLLAAALDRLVERHETLRTTFPTRGGQPVQVIGPACPVPLPVIDVSALPEARQEEAVERLLAPGAQPPFDLATGPLLRVALVRRAADEHLVLGTLHHIVSDAWSTWVAVRELSEMYGAGLQGRRPDLPDLPLQYADFAAWQRSWLQSGELEDQLAYWRRQLAGAAPTLDLPTDFPRPPLASSAGALRTRPLPPELLEGLKALSRRERSSLYMTLLSAWFVLLAQLTGREDLVVGTSVAARDRLELEGMIGFFVNVLALRTRLAGDPPFTEVLRRVRDTALEGYLHQSVPFDRLLEELQVGRDRGRNPLFQVAFTFENAPGRVGRFGDLALEALEMRFDTSVFDLALLMEETDRGLWSGMRYMTTLFRPATIDHWLAQLEVLLARIVAEPSAPVSRLLEVLAEEERRRRREQEEALAEASLRKLKTRTRTATLSQG